MSENFTVHPCIFGGKLSYQVYFECGIALIVFVELLVVKMIWRKINTIQLARITQKPARKLSNVVDVKPTNHVINAPPRPPKTKIGMAFRVA